jgi:hypothetical protein
LRNKSKWKGGDDQEGPLLDAPDGNDGLKAHRSNKMAEEKRLLTMTEPGEHVEVSQWAIRNWARERGLAHFKIGNRKRFKPEDVEKWRGKLREKGIIEWENQNQLSWKNRS